MVTPPTQTFLMHPVFPGFILHGKYHDLKPSPLPPGHFTTSEWQYPAAPQVPVDPSLGWAGKVILRTPNCELDGSPVSAFRPPTVRRTANGYRIFLAAVP